MQLLDIQGFSYEERHGFLPFKEISKNYFREGTDARTARIQKDLAEGQQLLHALVLRDPQRLVDEIAQLHRAVLGQPVGGVQVITEAELGLVRERGYRARALVRVDHEQVDGIGADVQDTQSHISTLPRQPIGMRTHGLRRHALRHGHPAPPPTSCATVCSGVSGRHPRCAGGPE